MELLHVAVVGAHVDDTRQPSAVAGREAALVEVDVFHHVGIERREQPHGVVDLVERRTVEQEQVLVAVAAVHVKAAGQLHALGHAAHALQRLHHVGRGKQGIAGLDVGLTERPPARLRGEQRRVEVARNQHLRQAVVLSEYNVLSEVGLQTGLQRFVAKTEIAVFDKVFALGQRE